MRGADNAATYRHGPIPDGRRMFEISQDEAIALGVIHGFSLIDHAKGNDTANREGVSLKAMLLRKNSSGPKYSLLPLPYGSYAGWILPVFPRNAQNADE